MKTLTVISALFIMGFAAPPQEAPAKLLDDAEAIMFSSCLQNKNRTISHCSCFVKGVKEKMPKLDYHFFMEALYYSNNSDLDNFNLIMEKYGKNIDDLTAMSGSVAEIGSKIEAKCSPSSSIKLPEPKS